MKFFKGQREKMHKTTLKKYSILALAAAFCILSAVSFLNGTNVRAERKAEAGEYVFRAEQDFGEAALGTLKMAAPFGPRLQNSDGEDLNYDANRKYSDDKVVFGLKEWAPAITYDQEYEGILKEWQETAGPEDAWESYTFSRDIVYNALLGGSYGKTYYFYGSAYGPEEVKSGFTAFMKEKVGNKMRLGNDSGKYFNLRFDQNHMYAVSEPVYTLASSDTRSEQEDAGGTKTSYSDYDWLSGQLSGYLAEYMERIGAKEYDDNTGVVILNGKTAADTSITFLRVGMAKLGIDYEQFRNSAAESGETLEFMSENYLPAFIFSGSNYPVHLVPKHDNPTAVTGSEEEIKPERTNNVLFDEEVRLQFGESRKNDNGAKLFYALYDQEYTEQEVEQSGKWKSIGEDTAIALMGEGLTGSRRYLYLKIKTGNPQQYDDSLMVKYQFTLGKIKTAAGIKGAVEGGGDSVDVGSRVVLSTKQGAAVFYTVGTGTNRSV